MRTIVMHFDIPWKSSQKYEAWLVVLVLNLLASALFLRVLPFLTFTGVQRPIFLFFSKVSCVADTQQYNGKS